MEALPRIEKLIDGLATAQVAVSFSRPTTGEHLHINADRPFHAASTMKVGVLMELFIQAEQSRLSLTDRITVHNNFHSIVDGSPFGLTEQGDSYPPLYKRLGATESLIDLARPMITESSNLATNVLVEHLGIENINTTLERLDAEGVCVLRGVEDIKAFREGLNNSVTARALTTLLTHLVSSEEFSASSRERMLEILLAQNHRNGIPAGLPPGVSVANKTGWTDRVCHDAAVVYPPNQPPYVLVVLVEGQISKTVGEAFIANVSKVVYEAAALG